MPEKTAEKRTWVTKEAQAKRVKLLTTIIIVAACLGPLALIVTFVRGTPPPTALPPEPLYRPQATAVVENWIQGQPSPIPFAETSEENIGRDQNSSPLPITGLAWALFETEAGFEDPNYFFEVHTFTAVLNGQVVFIDVTIGSLGEGPILVSLPSIVPARYLPGAQDLPFSLESYGEPTTLTPDARSRINEWAVAYGQNNTGELYELTGDEAPNRYEGIPGGNYLTVGEPIIIQTVTTPEGATITRIEVKYAPPFTEEEIATIRQNNPTAGNNLTTQSPNTGKGFSLQFDLLIGGIERTLPFITAWGPPGYAPLLTPYQNAVLPSSIPQTTTTTSTTTTSTTTTQPPQP